MRNNRTQVFVPGALSGFFSVHAHDDPKRAGSRGAGLALSDGVTINVCSTDTNRTILRFNDEQITVEAVDRVLDTLGVTARVDAETPLPIGAGFGVSGALALGTAIAANQEFGLAKSENELITIAHVAEVQAGTGLGDVIGQARGGVRLVREPGSPQYNLLDGIPAVTPIEYVVFDTLSTESILANDSSLSALSTAGEQALERLTDTPTLPALMSASRRFSQEAELLTPNVHRAIQAVDEVNGEAAMAMLGDTVFALETGLSDAGYKARKTQIHTGGATLID